VVKFIEAACAPIRYAGRQMAFEAGRDELAPSRARCPRHRQATYGSRLHTYSAEIEVPTESIVRGPWQETVIEGDALGVTRIKRLAYLR